MIKKEKGITVISLSIAVIIILAITGMILYSAKDSIYIQRLTNMQNDIANLRDKVSLYYSEYGEIPAKTEYFDISNLQTSGVIGANDTGKFLILEIENLEGLTLNYGKDYEKYKANDYTDLADLTDIYIINDVSHNIFYVQGINVKENDQMKTYYTDYTEGDKQEVQLIEIKENTIKVGDYVNYTYDEKNQGYTLLASQSGYINDQTINQKSEMKWRILNIHTDGTVDLIGDINSFDQTVYFMGGLGYNNGVYLLNDICKELYSNSNLEIEARSINLEDIENQMSEEGIRARNTYNNGTITYGKSKTYTENNTNYPNLYARENGSGINSQEPKKDGIEVSDNGYTSQTQEISTKADSLTVTQNRYYFSNPPASYFKDYDGNSSAIKDLLFETETEYWLASRFANCYSVNVDFGLCNIATNKLNEDILLYDSTSGTTGEGNRRIRPVISLGNDIEITAVENADGSNTKNMHQISKK